MSIRALTWSGAVAILWIAAFAEALRAESIQESGRSFFFKNIPSNAPVADLLPMPPKAATKPAWPMKDLAAVPEVFFQDPQALAVSPKASDRELKKRSRDVSNADVDRIRKRFGNNLSSKEIMDKLDEEAVEREKAEERIAFQIFRVNVLNRKGPDHFLEVLRENRPDLAGLPFVMGKACRLSDTEHKQFAAAVALVQGSLGPDQEDPKNFWRYFEENRAEQKNFSVDEKKKFPVPDGRMCVVALTQMLPVESAELQLSLVGRLEQFDNTPADKKAVTLALARLAVFAQEQAIRQAAVDRLKKRDSRPATGILLQGLRYPWPSIAQRAAEAIVQLQRKDLIPELTKVLEEPDPRAPESVDVKGTKGTKVSVVRELVRINHMRNCLLCHPPLLPPDGVETLKEGRKLQDMKDNGRRHVVDVLSVNEVAGPIPPPGHALQSASPQRGSGYGFSTRDQQIRADVTYLRQDFSLLQLVPDADPWPEMQRFDFLVRTRMLNAEKANMIRTALAGQSSPYVAAAQDALRRLTGKDAGAKATD